MKIWRLIMMQKDRTGRELELSYRLTADAYKDVQKEMFWCLSQSGGCDDYIVSITATNGEGMTISNEGMFWSRAALNAFEEKLREASEASAKEGVY